jgi:hypothetical protein
MQQIASIDDVIAILKMRRSASERMKTHWANVHKSREDSIVEQFGESEMAM